MVADFGGCRIGTGGNIADGEERGKRQVGMFHVKHLRALDLTPVSRGTTVTQTLDILLQRLSALDGRGYKAYKEARGSYATSALTFHLDHPQGDPFAEPSRARAVMDPEEANLPDWAYSTRDQRRATADYLNRRLVEMLQAAERPAGSGSSGRLTVLNPGQQVLERASLQVTDRGVVTARFRIGLPAKGRRIDGKAAATLVQAAVDAAIAGLCLESWEELRRHVEAVEDAVALRSQLEDRGLVAFVANGAILPRLSGIDDRPLDRSSAVPFQAPSSLTVTLEAPHAGAVDGMGIPEGVTLIVGGGYHGKSTLLRAVERGVYDHVPEDGRERVVAVADAAKIRAEDGRSVAGTDISNFIGALPSGSDTRCFQTENASGSTSQAAAIIEALEAGARALLVDEDTSATNFMIRDARMQRLVHGAHEPITPFIDRVRGLYEALGVSTVIVVGGSGDYFDVADTVIALRDYRPLDQTREARAIAAELPTARSGGESTWRPYRDRAYDLSATSPARGNRDLSIRVLSRDRVMFGREHLDLSAVEQLVETAQTRAIAYAIARAHARSRDPEPIAATLNCALEEIEREGLTVVHPHAIGELAGFRPLEMAAVLNRLRSLRTREAAE
jgi:predicted ABC-class ATPase